MRRPSQNTGPGPSQRQLRVGEEIRRAIVEAMQHGHFHDPDLMDAHITVTDVSVSPDLKNAKAYIVTLGGDKLDTTIEALNRASNYFRKEIARIVNLKFTPQIRFEADRSFEYADRINQLIKEHPLQQDD